MIRLIVPPLPAVSRPSKIDGDPQAVGAHRLLQLHELLLHALELALVGLLVSFVAMRAPSPGPEPYEGRGLARGGANVNP